MRFDRVWINARLATLSEGSDGLGVVEKGAVAAKDGRIAFAGPAVELPSAWDAPERSIATGVGSHQGLWIAIPISSSAATGRTNSTAPERRQLRGNRPRRRRHPSTSGRPAPRARTTSSQRPAPPRPLIGEGCTTIEVKSGYGLDLETEARMLRAARRLGDERPFDRTTFLGAQPSRRGGRRQGRLHRRGLPRHAAGNRAEGLADAVDAFCETIAFSPEQTARVFDAAEALGLPIKLHADQLSNLARRRARRGFGALSADHLEYTDEDGAAAMARRARWRCCCRAPITCCARRRRRPSRRFRRHGVPSRSRPTAIPAPRR